MREEEAIDAVKLAAIGAGLPAHDASVVRVGENGVVLLPSAGVLARVVPRAAKGSDPRREIDIAAWFASRQVPVVHPARPEPLIVGQYVVSLWEYLADSRPADLVTLAKCLRRLHAVAIPEKSLPILSPFDRFEERYGRAPASMLATALFCANSAIISRAGGPLRNSRSARQCCTATRIWRISW
ncbi:hypothetical protein ACFHW0_26200 [Micromonospora sp. LOL_025]|uniref:hypothetical protein n=1 Tax=Micromonospora sp. LOL_025 TaxID=3345413 RepID=UPI003A891FB8